MPIDLKGLGFDKDSLKQLLDQSNGKLKLRLGDGKIVDLLQEHLTSGIPGGLGKSTVDDHDKVSIKGSDGHEKVRSVHEKTGKVGQDLLIRDDNVLERDGVFIGDLSEADLVKLKADSGDLLKDRDFMIIRKLLGEK